MWSTKRNKSQRKKCRLVQKTQQNPKHQSDVSIDETAAITINSNSKTPTYLKEYIILSIEKWPELESKQIISKAFDF